MVKRKVELNVAAESRVLMAEREMKDNCVEDSESGSDSGSEQGCTARLRRSPVRCCLLISTAVLAVVLIAVVLTVNAWAKAVIESIGTHALGVPTTLGSVSIALLVARSELRDLQVANPVGFSGDFLSLEEGILDLKLSSLLNSPLDIQEILFKNLEVSIEQPLGGESNIEKILAHANSVAPRTSATVPDTVHTLTKRFVVDKIVLEHINAKICVMPLCNPDVPGIFEVKKVQVNSIGTKTGGVELYEIIIIVVQALLVAIAKSAPSQLGQGLMGSLASSLPLALKSSDYGSIQYDVGHGLEEAGAWTSWQLDRFSKSTKALGNVMAGGVETAGTAVSHGIDSVLGVENRNDAMSQAVKSVVDEGTSAVSEALAGVVRNSTGELGNSADEIGQNLSSNMGTLGKSFTGMLGVLGSKALRGAMPQASS